VRRLRGRWRRHMVRDPAWRWFWAAMIGSAVLLVCGWLITRGVEDLAHLMRQLAEGAVRQ
jgi:hypothetical protein